MNQVRMLKQFQNLAVLMLLLFFLPLAAGCGGGADSRDVVPHGGPNDNPTTGKIAISGTIVQEGTGRSGAAISSDITPQHVSNPVPMENATIVFTPSSGSAITVTTDDDGSFEIERDDMPEGIYKVQIEAGSFSSEFHVRIDEDTKELLTEFASAEDDYTRIEKTDENTWTREIEPDGTYVTTESGKTKEEHFSNALTVSYDASDIESWILDENANFTEDTVDPVAPELTEENDTDSDGCHNMRDFMDNDNDNDSSINFDDSNYNTNLLVGAVHNIDTDCVPTAPAFAVFLQADNTAGDAPLQVNAQIELYADLDNIEKFEWLSGKPGAPAQETQTPGASFTYTEYGTFVLTAIIHLVDGRRLIDTLPIYVRKTEDAGQLEQYTTFEAVCESDNCYTMDVNVDQYGNVFVLAEDWDGGPDSMVSVHDPHYEHVNTIDMEDGSMNVEIVSMAMDKNGFIYLLDTEDRLAVTIHNSLGEQVKEVDVNVSGEDGFMDYMGLAINDAGNLFIGHIDRSADKAELIKCTRASDYTCEQFAEVDLTPDIFVGIFELDVDMTSDDEVAFLHDNKVFYYNQDGTLLRTHTLQQISPFNAGHLAVGPDDEFYAGYNDTLTNSIISAYSSSGDYQYEFNVPYFIWGMHVDNIGILYVTTYSQGIVSLYAPGYIVNQSAGRALARNTDVPGFTLHPVTIIRTDGR